MLKYHLRVFQVRKRRKPEPPEVAADDDDFFADMKELLHDEEHMDAVFVIRPPSSDYHSFKNMNDMKMSRNVGDNIYMNNRSQMSAIIGDYKPDVVDSMDTGTNSNTSSAMLQTSSSAMAMVMDEPLPSQPPMIRIRAHKSVLTARAEYFKSFFRMDASSGNNSKMSVVVGNDGSNANPTMSTSNLAFKESKEATVNVDSTLFNEMHIRAMLEFIYTNRIANLHKLPTDDVLSILHLSDMWLLRDLKRICEHELIRSHLTILTVAQLYGATEAFNAKRLARAWIEFIMSNLRQVTGSPRFLEELKNFPHLMLPVLKAAADLIPEGPVHKKQRTVSAVATPHNVPSGLHDPHSAAAAAVAAAQHAGSVGNIDVAVGVASFRSSPVPDSDA